MSHHGVAALRGIEHVACSPFQDKERFGRLFPSLPGLEVPQEDLLALAASMEERTERKAGDSATVTAGFTFFGQFVDHDITLDTTSSLERQNDPAAIRNFRTPLLELDNVYGSGPDATPYLYDRNRPGRLLTGNNDGNPDDLPRNSQGTALIGDPRNDENGIVSQLQLAFLRFHNATYALVEEGKLPCHRYYDATFREAQRLVRWHYQWIIVHEFLPLIIDAAVLALGPLRRVSAATTGTSSRSSRWSSPSPPTASATARSAPATRSTPTASTCSSSSRRPTR